MTGRLLPHQRSTDDSRDIIAAAVQGLRRLWNKGYAYHKASLMLLNLSPKANYASSKPHKPMKRQSVASAADGNDRHELDKRMVQLGMPRKGNAYALHSERCTPRYTT